MIHLILASWLLISVNSVPITDKEDIIDLSHFGIRMYGLPETDIGNTIEQSANISDVNPEELGPYAEGDILIPHGAPRSGIVGESYRWPGGIVPYEVSRGFSAKARAMIVNECLEAYHRNTCLRFRPRKTSDQNYVFIDNGYSGCWSSVGMNGGRQVVNLQETGKFYDCVWFFLYSQLYFLIGCTTKVGTCIHEMMHALGFFHEQTRTDRDSYVRVNYQNIKPGYSSNFNKAKAGEVNNQGVGYDYGSVMHYNLNAFSSNGQQTMATLKQTNAKVGQREAFSRSDIQKLNNMYKCGGATASGTSGTGSGSLLDFFG